MSKLFSSIILSDSMAFTTPDGKVRNIAKSHARYKEICDKINEIKAFSNASDEVAMDNAIEELVDLVEVSRMIATGSNGRIEVKNGVVYYLGEAIDNTVTKRIISGLIDGHDMSAYMRFLDSLMDNPSKTAVTELYGHLETHSMGIMEDGRILAYKKVRDDYTDIFTGTINNSIGEKPKMRRNLVDDNRLKACSTGYHFCSLAYIPYFGVASGNHIMIVAVWPRDVVSVPADHGCAKVRCCEYEVIGEYTGDDLKDILSTKSVWDEGDIKREFNRIEPWLTSDDEYDDDTDCDDYTDCDDDADFCDFDDAEVSEPVDSNNTDYNEPITKQPISDETVEEQPSTSLGIDLNGNITLK